MRLEDASDGDIVQIGEVQYRLMIKHRAGFMCRWRDDPEDEWSDNHAWLTDGTTIDSIVLEQPRRHGKQSSNVDPLDRDAAENDSLNWKGTNK